jgi:hypothetical protein
MQSESSDSNLMSPSDDELDTEIVQLGVKLIQTCSKRCGQAPGPKAKTKRVRKEQRFVESEVYGNQIMCISR